MQQLIKTPLLSTLAFVLLLGLLLSGGRAIYVWWTWHHGNHFCATPLSDGVVLWFVAFVLFSCLVGTLRLLAKKKNAA
jgi:hypothetical protein